MIFNASKLDFCAIKFLFVSVLCYAVLDYTHGSILVV